MTDDVSSDQPAKKPARRRSTTPAKATPASRPAKPDATATKADVKKAKAPPKPRAAKRSAPAAAHHATAKKASPKKATDKVGGRWGAAAIAGGLAAAGAAAALLTLRGSSTKPGDPAKPKGTAHQPDGSDSSRSFDAGIADENTIPDKA